MPYENAVKFLRKKRNVVSVKGRRDTRENVSSEGIAGEGSLNEAQ